MDKMACKYKPVIYLLNIHKFYFLKSKKTDRKLLVYSSSTSYV